MTRTVTHAEAREIARRLIAAAIRAMDLKADPNLRPRFSIPARLDEDDDCLLAAYIDQQEHNVRSSMQLCRAISYALQTDDGLEWLRAWNEGDPQAMAELEAWTGE